MFRIFFENSTLPYSIHRIQRDEHGEPCDYVYLFVNDAYRKLLKLENLDVLNKRFYELFPKGWDGEEQWKEAFHRAINKDQPTSMIMHHFSIGKWIQIEIFPLMNDIYGCIHHDVTKEYNQDKEIQGFFQVNVDMLCVADTGGKFLKVNKAFEEILGYSKEELEGKSFINLIHDDDLEESFFTLQALKNQQSISQYVNRVRRKDGEYRYIEWHSKPNGKYIYSSARDITEKRLLHIQLRKNNEILLKLTEELKEKNLVLEDMAIKDELTGVYNRHFLKSWIEEQIRRSDEEHWSMSMLLFDVDYFKVVNDTWGHIRGDEVLRQIAELVSKVIRKSDLFARHGGEEFCIVMQRCDLSNAAIIAEKIRSHLADYVFPVVGKQTASFGVAERNENESFKSWYKRTDEALYIAKKNGRNCVVRWEQDLLLETT